MTITYRPGRWRRSGCGSSSSSPSPPASRDAGWFPCRPPTSRSATTALGVPCTSATRSSSAPSSPKWEWRRRSPGQCWRSILRRTQRHRVQAEHRAGPGRLPSPTIRPRAPTCRRHGWRPVRPDDYVSLQVYVPYTEADRTRPRSTCARRHPRQLDGVAATWGTGPASFTRRGSSTRAAPTGRGGAARRPEARPNVPIPGFRYDFGTLIAAEAIGDHQSLPTTAGGSCGSPSTTSPPRRLLDENRDGRASGAWAAT